MWSDLTLSPSSKVKQGQPNLKVLITHLLLVLEVCSVKPTYRMSWAGNRLMSDLTLVYVSVITVTQIVGSPQSKQWKSNPFGKRLWLSIRAHEIL